MTTTNLNALAHELSAMVGGADEVSEENAADFAAAAGVNADDLWTAVGRLADERLPSCQPIRRSVGAYRQADLEQMTADDLAALCDWAVARFNAVDAAAEADEAMAPGFGHTAANDAASEYYELLAGAADELLLARRTD